MQRLVRAKSAWASLLERNFQPKKSFTLKSYIFEADTCEKFIAIPPQEVDDGKIKQSATLVRHVLGKYASYYNLKNFAEEK